jgi:hypothetical protein
MLKFDKICTDAYFPFIGNAQWLAAPPAARFGRYLAATLAPSNPASASPAQTRAAGMPRSSSPAAIAHDSPGDEM